MTVAAVRQAIADACATVTGLHAAAYVPDQINPPQAVVGTVEFDPRMVFAEGKCERQIRVTVYVNRTNETAAQKLIDTYTELSGSTSLIAAIQGAAALQNGSTADYVTVTNIRGPIPATVGDIKYLIIELDLEAVF